MSKVLFIKANDRAAEQEVSLQLYNVFLANYKEAHPGDKVIILDLFAENLPHYNTTMMNGMIKLNRGFKLTSDEQKAAAIVNIFLNQFLEAEKVVFAFPLWNMTVPAVLDTYFDYLNQAAKTFLITHEGPVSLVTKKKIAVLNSCDGECYEEPKVAKDMVVNFVLRNLELFGVKNIETVIVEGSSIVEEGMDATGKLASIF